MASRMDHAPHESTSRHAPRGKLLNRSPLLQARRAAAAAREPAPTIDDFAVAWSAPDVQLERFDDALVAVRRAVVPGWGDEVRAHAARGTRGGGGRLPYAERIQASFGAHDIGSVQAHAGGETTAACDAMGAVAYAHGEHVAFGHSPSLHTAAHEAAHVVQQRAGVALGGGVGQAGDAYEQHADAVADLVVRGQSAEALLDRFAGGGGGAAVQCKVHDDGKSSDVQRAPDSDRARMAAVSERLNATRNQATATGEALGAHSDACVKAARAAMGHLKVGLERYSAAYQSVQDVLAKAEVRYQIEQTITSAVKDMVFGLALGGLAPQAKVVMALGGVKKEHGEIVSKLPKLQATLTEEAVDAGAGHAATAVDGAEAGAAPKDSISGVGLNPGDKALDAFNALADLVGALPELGQLATHTVKLGTLAAMLSEQASLVGAGQKAKLTAMKIESFTEELEGLLALVRPAEKRAAAARAKVEGLAREVTKVAHPDVQTIEKQLWTQWLASRRTRAEKDLMDNDVIERHLESFGLVQAGGYTSDADEDQGVIQAQKRILLDKGIAIPDSDAKITSVYRREMKRDELSRACLGKVGVISGANRCDVAGLTFACPGNAGAEVGDAIVVKLIVPSEHRQDPNIVVEEWTSKDFDALGSKT